MKRLAHSLLISWVAPRLSGEEHVEEYRIDVNEQLKTIVDGEKSSAVVENIHEAGTYRISVSAVLADGVHSGWSSSISKIKVKFNGLIINQN